MATYAGVYSEHLQDRYGNGYRNALVAVQTLAAAPVTLYADRVKTAYVPASGLAANEIKADTKGNLRFFADPGNYQIVVTPSGGSTLAAFPVSVLPDPLEPDASEGALAAEQAARIAADDALSTSVAGKVSKADNLSDLVDIEEARGNLGLGDAAIQDAADLPVSDAQGAALAAKADATALTTETTNRQNADTAHVAATDPHGDRAYATSGLAGKQPLDSDLTAIAGLSTVAFGRSFLELGDAAAARTHLELADSGWILPTLLTDVTAGSAWAHLGYRKVSGVVYVVVDLLIANPATAKHLFTLPAGFRWGPAGTTNQMGFIGISNSIRVRENGEVRAHAANASVTIALSYPAGG